MADVTELLVASRDGDADASGRLMTAVYDELRGIAAAYRARHEVGDTLSATSLVHECYLKLVNEGRLAFDSRAHFFGAAARAMRQVIVDDVRARKREKRGGGLQAIRLDDVPTLATPEGSDGDRVLALDAALGRFADIDARAARVVECRYFAGLTIEETAAALDLSPMTVKRDWAAARVWLHRALAEAA